MIRTMKTRWLAVALAVCMLMGLCPAAWAEGTPVAAAAETEETPVDAAEAAEAPVREKSLVLQTIEHLKTGNWKELPQELKDFIDETNWQELQQQLRNHDWRGALDTIKSFFTDTEWDDVGQEIEHQFLLMLQEGTEGVQALEEKLSGLSLDSFVSNLESAAKSALQALGAWVETAKSAVESALGPAMQAVEEAMEDVAENVQDALSDLLEQLGL